MNITKFSGPATLPVAPARPKSLPATNQTPDIHFGMVFTERDLAIARSRYADFMKAFNNKQKDSASALDKQRKAREGLEKELFEKTNALSAKRDELGKIVDAISGLVNAIAKADGLRKGLEKEKGDLEKRKTKLEGEIKALDLVTKMLPGRIREAKKQEKALEALITRLREGRYKVEHFQKWREIIWWMNNEGKNLLSARP